MVATKDFHPEMLEAGTNLAKLIQNTIIKAALSKGITGLIELGLPTDQAKAIYDQFDEDYKKIIKKAKKAADK